MLTFWLTERPSKLSYLESKFQTTSLTFSSVIPQSAVSSLPTYGCPLGCCLPPIFQVDSLTLHQPLRPRVSLVLVSRSGRNAASPGQRGATGQRAQSTPLQRRTVGYAYITAFCCRENGATSRSEEHQPAEIGLKRSCVWKVMCVRGCVFVRVSVCLRCRRLWCCKSRTFLAPAAQPLRVPWEAPMFMGKPRLHFKRYSRGLASCGCVGNIEKGDTIPPSLGGMLFSCHQTSKTLCQSLKRTHVCMAEVLEPL